MRKRKTALAIFFLLIVIVYAVCHKILAEPYGYSIKVIKNGHIYFGTSEVEITEADRDTLIGLKQKAMFYEDVQMPKLPLDNISAAKFGIRLLDKNYQNWTENKQALILYNKNANAWIICGQRKDWYSMNPVGLCVLSKDGDILALACDGAVQ